MMDVTRQYGNVCRTFRQGDDIGVASKSKQIAILIPLIQFGLRQRGTIISSAVITNS